MDLVTEFAAPLSLQVILQLCDLPAADVQLMIRWFPDINALTMSVLEPARQVACARSFVAAQRYMADLVERRRAAPGDDLISSLLGVRAEEGAPLDTAEIANTTVGTMLAGHDTTTALIVNAMFILLSSPERWAAVRERPGTIPGVLEETLRVDSPVPVFIRTAVREVTVGGAAIPEGPFSCWHSGRPIATPRGSRIPTATTLPAPRTRTSPSGAGSTHAWEEG